MRTSQRKYIAVYILSGIFILWAIYTRMSLIYSYSIDLDGAEFTFIHFVQILLSGEPLYRDPCDFPFIAVMYTPLYSYLLYYLSALLGYTTETDPHQFYVLARWIALAFAFINAAVIYKILKRLHFSSGAVLIAITFYLLFITGHFYVARPDAIKLTFFSVFLYALLEYLFYQGSRIYLLLAVVAGLMGVLLKQDAALYILLLLATALVYLHNRKVIHLILGFAAGSALVLVAFRLFWGPYFYDNTILFNFQITTDVVKTFNTKVILTSVIRSFPLLLLAIYGCYRAVKNYSDKQAHHYIAIIALFTYIIGHLAIFRAGAYFNYTFEGILLVIINAAILIRAHWQFFANKMQWWTAGASFYMLFLFGISVLTQTYFFYNKNEAQNRENYELALQEKSEIDAIIKNDTVFFPNPKYLIFYPATNVIYGYEMHFDRLVNMLHGFQSSTRLLFVSPENYDSYFSEGRVQFIIAENNEGNRNGVSKYYPDYKELKTLKNLVLYKYRPHSPETE